jgi:alpha-tubulin suppressor-like RCC1 family protein
MPVLISLVSCGYYHSLALTPDGIALSTGNNKNGELGRTGLSNTFQKVDTELKFSNINAGFGVSFFITPDSKLFSCGKKQLNALGTNVEVP